MKVPEPRKLKSGTWFIQLRLGGRSISVSEATKADCVRQAQKIKAAYLADRDAVPRCKADPTLREAFAAYIRQAETLRRSPETIRGYDIIARNRFQGVMDCKIRDVHDWQAVYNAEASNHAPKTVANSWALLKAVCAGVGVKLPEVKKVSPQRTEHAFLEPEQIRAFVAASAGDPYRIALLLALHSCRVSEILAIDWADVDLKEERVRIRGAVVRDRNNKKIEKAENKTAGSARWVALVIPELLEELRAVKDRSGKLVTANENTLLKHANRVCDAAGLPHVGVHGLRHSFASLCYSLQVPERITMRMGGWDNSQTVNEIYTHLAKKDINKHVDSLREFYKNANPER